MGRRSQNNFLHWVAMAVGPERRNNRCHFMRLQKILIAVLLIILFYSCAHPETKVKGKNPSFSRLRIAVDTNSNFYLDSVRISDNYQGRGSNYLQYDSSLKQLVY